MRRIWYSVAMSLDGFIAGPNGEYDWIPDEPNIDWGAFMGRFDTVLMGRRSWEASLSSPGGGAMPGIRTIVFSRTLNPADHPQVTIVREATPEMLNELRRTPGKDIWLFGGGELFRNLLEAGQVDHVEVGLTPVLIGQGIPLLPRLDTITKLRLTDTKSYPSGIILLTYEVLKA